MTSLPSATKCASCGFLPDSLAKYCPQCGQRLGVTNKPSLSLFNLGLILLFGVAIWSFPWLIRTGTIGTPPTPESSAPMAKHSSGSVYSDPDLKRLKDGAEKDPTSKQGWIELSNALIARYQALEKPDSELVFALLEASQQILKIDPSDKDSILVIGDVAYDQQVFEKAVEYYSQYLAMAPQDDAIRQKYASGLAFLGKFDQAKKELGAVLMKDPKNFSATAYLAITAAQAGDKKEALEIGEKALSLAPNKEAKAKFQEFLDLVNSKPAGQPKLTQPEPELTGPIRGASAILNAIRESPIAGPKLVNSKEENGHLILYLQDFPMAAMPPFAKEKFFGRLKEAAKSEPKIEAIEFRDAASRAKIDTLLLK